MKLIVEPDHGTPPAPEGALVTLTIDGRPVSVPAGTSVMRAASLAGQPLPKLCATDSLKAFGSCRVCLVEIEGRAGLPASCTTPVAEGMAVRTSGERLDRVRRGVVELYLSDFPADALEGDGAFENELKTVAETLGVTGNPYAPGCDHQDAAVDASNPYFAFDPAKCILCSSCVRACDEVQGTFALTIAGRGFGSKVSASQEDPFLASECVSCGACVQACPTGSLREKAVAELGRPEWSAVTTCAYCGVGCTFKAEMRGEQVVRMMPWKEG
jgi:formate dehydrogenase major subunit